MLRMAMASSRTTGRFSMVPIPRMATWGWLMIGVPKRLPKTPGFVIVKVPPCTSSTFSFFVRARSARSLTAFAMPRRFFSSAFRTTGTMRPQSRATAIPCGCPS